MLRRSIDCGSSAALNLNWADRDPSADNSFRFITSSIIGLAKKGMG